MRTPSLKTVVLCTALSCAPIYKSHSQSNSQGIWDFRRASLDILNAKIQQRQDSINTATYWPSLLDKTNKSLVELENTLQLYIPDYITQQLEQPINIPVVPEKYAPAVIKKVSIETAVGLVNQPRKVMDTLKIYQVVWAKVPFNYGKTFDKKYIFWHGSAGDDKSLVWTWHNEWLFAYAILRNWVVIQFFDDKKWLWAIWWFGAVDNNALSNFEGIAVEFSAKLNSRKTDVVQPNEAQLRSAQLLKQHLENKHDIKGSYTSRQAVQFVPEPYEDKVHYDTKTRSQEIIDALWVVKDPTPPTFTPKDIKERLRLSSKLRYRNGTQNSSYAKMVKQYIASRKATPTTIPTTNATSTASIVTTQ